MITKIKILLMLAKSLVSTLIKAKIRAIKKRKKMEKQKTGVQLIEIERNEQITKHGFTVKSDVEKNHENQLAVLSDLLLTKDFVGEINPDFYPPGTNKDLVTKMLLKTYKDRLVIAGALIAAEIDRLQFVETPVNETETKTDSENKTDSETENATDSIAVDDMSEAHDVIIDHIKKETKPIGRGINELRKPRQ